MRLGELQGWVDPTERALDAGADIGVFRGTGANPLRIVRWGFLCSVAWDVAAFVAKLDHTTHDKAGTPTRSDGSGGVNIGLTVDQVVGSLVYAEPTSDLILKPGDFFTFQVTSAMTAGDGHPFVHFQALNFQPLPSLRAEFSDEDGTAASQLRIVDGSVAI